MKSQQIMKLIIHFVSLLITIGTAFSEVPSLINYQGRLTNAEGEPLTGTKNFELKIFDAQTDGNLLYTENVGPIQLAEGGVYSFQFGGKGTSNTQTTETVGTGNGENLYQKVLSNTPVVEGSVSVSDETYTWSQEDGSSNEDDFSSSFSKNLSRITVNYFADSPNDNRDIKVTYRYEAEGILGALSSGSEHWLQLSIDGETQATRERVLAVPFALRAGVAKRLDSSDTEKHAFLKWNRSQQSGYNVKVSTFPSESKKIKKLRLGIFEYQTWNSIDIHIYRIDLNSPGMGGFLYGGQYGDSEGELIYIKGTTFSASEQMTKLEPPDRENRNTWLYVHEFEGGLELNHEKYAYELRIKVNGGGSRWIEPIYARITYLAE